VTLRSDQQGDRSSSSPAKKKSKLTDCINEEITSVISVSAKSNEAEEIASVISGSAKSDEAKEEGLAYLVIEDFAQVKEESKRLLLTILPS